MKFETILIVLAAVLLIAAASDAVPAIFNHGILKTEIIDNPEIGYALNYMPTPDWWPH